MWEKVVTPAAVTELILSWVSLPAPPGGLSYSESRQTVFSVLQDHTLPQEQTLSLRTQGPRTRVRFQGLACHPLGEEPASFPVLCHWGAWGTDTEPRRFWSGQAVQVCFWWLECKSPSFPSSTFLHPWYYVAIFLRHTCLCISPFLLELSIFLRYHMDSRLPNPWPSVAGGRDL